VLFADELGMPRIGVAVPERDGSATVLTPVHVPEHRRSWGERELVPAEWWAEERRMPIGSLTPLPAAPPAFSAMARFAAMDGIPEHLHDEARAVIEAASAINTRLQLATSVHQVAGILNEASGRRAYAVDGAGGLVAAGAVPVLRPGPQAEPGDPASLVLPSGVELD
jgi:hypothetical protein